MKEQSTKTVIGVFFFIVALIFVYRSFYCMRIPEESSGPAEKAAPPEPAAAKAMAR
jgi:hypothetical protein